MLISFIAVFYLTAGILLLFLGLIIARENLRQRTNWMLGLLLFFAAVGSTMNACGLLIQPGQIDSLVVKRVFVAWEFFFPQLLLLALFFPRPCVRTRLHRLIWLIFLPQLLHLLLILMFQSSEEILLLNSVFDLPLFEEWLQPLALLGTLLVNLGAYFFEIHDTLFTLVNCCYVVLALGIMLRNYRSTGEQALPGQNKLVLGGIIASVGLYTLAFLFPKIFQVHLNTMVPHLLTMLALSVGMSALAWAIIRYQFLDIQFFIRKSIIFSMGSALLIGCYLLLYNYTKEHFAQPLRFQLPIFEIIFLIFAAVFFQPILSFLENLVEKYFVKSSIDYQDILHDLSQDILSISTLEQLNQKIVNPLKETFLLESVYLILQKSPGNFSLEGVASENNFNLLRNHPLIEQLLKSNTPVSMEAIDLELAQPPDLLPLRKLKVALLVPLVHRGDLDGILCLGRKLTHADFTTEEKTLLSILATQIAIAFENSKLYQEKLAKRHIDEEMSIAREIQRMLLPQQFPREARFEISAINIPSQEIGGDYYDFIQFDSQHVGLAIGDIAGKGIPGSLLMSNLQATFRAAAQISQDPSAVMNLINKQITRTTTPEKYATFFYGIFNAEKYLLTYTNAGHNLPLIIRADQTINLLKESDLIIGVDEHVNYRQTQIRLRPGDFLICYTDGVTEALNSQLIEFGEERFYKLLLHENWSSAQELRNYIYETVHEYMLGTKQYDDLTLVILMVK
ncbi:SpoIIE family protein phosphatase [candidate division KSB1 bacterium]|nr:SpoIIE family protein phosphatase [candidate division KSB1 bacterium]